MATVIAAVVYGDLTSAQKPFLTICFSHIRPQRWPLSAWNIWTRTSSSTPPPSWSKTSSTGPSAPDPSVGLGRGLPTQDQTRDWSGAGYDSTILKSYQERFLHFSLEQFQEVRSQASTLRGSRGMRAWNIAWLKCQEVRQQLQERVQEADEAYLRRQHAALLCDCGDVDADVLPPFSGGEETFLQSTPGPSHPQWAGLISGAVELDKRRPILGKSCSAGAEVHVQLENANVSQSNQGSKVIPASPHR